MRKEKKHGAKSSIKAAGRTRRPHGHGGEARRARPAAIPKELEKLVLPETAAAATNAPRPFKETHAEPAKLEALTTPTEPASLPDPKLEAPLRAAKRRGTARRSAIALALLMASAACVFGVMKRCESAEPSGDEVDAAGIEADPDASSPTIVALRS